MGTCIFVSVPNEIWLGAQNLHRYTIRVLLKKEVNNCGILAVGLYAFFLDRHLARLSVLFG